MRAHASRYSMRSVAVVLVLLGSIGAVLLVTSPTASALTYVRGVITVDTTWGVADTTYIVTGPVTVRAPRTLTIMPGTTVKFDSGVHLFIEGRLMADGTAAKPITFAFNGTSSPFTWGGIQFNASSSGSVSRSTFDRVDRAVTATDSSPNVTTNTVIQAGLGFGFVRSQSIVSNNTIRRATNLGIYANASSAQIVGNSINGTGLGIQVEFGGSPAISRNTITNVSGTFAIGILVTSGAAASIDGNSIRGVRGSSGGPGSIPGASGRNGSFAAGIYAYGVPSVSISSNAIDTVIGGRGGDGQANPGGTARRGGNGGPGGSGGTTNGNGGVGGDADGLFLIAVVNVDASGNFIQAVQGGIGGNGVLSGGATTGNGATGGAANGAAAFYVSGSATIHANTFQTLAGGDGGRGVRGGYGGNATGVVTFGNNDGRFNATQVTFNQIVTVTGGAGGLGARFGGNGGAAAGIASVFVSPTLASNWVSTLQGGRGGDALDMTDGGRGGDALGVASGLVANGLSSGDTISGVTKGGAGSGVPVQTSYADGYFVIGNQTFRTRFTADNATLTSVGTYEFYVENYTEVVAVNSPFTKLAVMAAGNLTVRNYLEVDALWPNGLTPVAGARIAVMDGGTRVWDRPAPSGVQPWILVTDRIYINSRIPTDNLTQASVTYLPYSFTNDPRFVDMATSHTESFVMVDTDPPISAASPLPKYESALTFTVAYTASDGNGTR